MLAKQKPKVSIQVIIH